MLVQVLRVLPRWIGRMFKELGRSSHDRRRRSNGLLDANLFGPIIATVVLRMQEVLRVLIVQPKQVHRVVAAGMKYDSTKEGAAFVT